MDKNTNYPTTQPMDAVDVFPYLDWGNVSTLTPEVINSHNSLSESSRRQTNDYACEMSRKTIKHRTNCSRHVESHVTTYMFLVWIKVITKLPNSEQSYKGKVKTHNYINRQNQSTTGKL